MPPHLFQRYMFSPLVFAPLFFTTHLNRAHCPSLYLAFDPHAHFFTMETIKNAATDAKNAVMENPDPSEADKAKNTAEDMGNK
ncbi:unnamed protein product, partial [Ectocarpus sp. 12 AP-2014]